MIRPTYQLALATALSMSMAVTSHAAIITDAIVGSTIDPAGDQDRDASASGSADIATVNALSGLTVIQDWGTGWSGTSNTIELGVGQPDVTITTTGGELQIFNSSAVSSSPAGSNDLFMRASDGDTITIDFSTPQATVAMMLLNFGGAYGPGNTVAYLDTVGDVLSTQTYSGGPTNEGNGSDVFTGYISGSANIASVVLTLDRNPGESDIGIDDLGFVVPEPTSLALVGVGGLMCLTRRRRR